MSNRIHRLLCRVGIHCWYWIVDTERVQASGVLGLYYDIRYPKVEACRVCGKLKR
jgi:hypothetical protein